MDKIFLKQIELKNFRKFNQLKLPIDRSPYTIKGPNGFGKTTILEAIYYCLNGRSPFTANPINILNNELLNKVNNHSTKSLPLWQSLKFASVNLKLADDTTITKRLILNSESQVKSEIMLNQKKTQRAKLRQILIPLLFSPEYVELLSNKRGKRLDLFDSLGKYLDPTYSRKLNHFQKLLQQRNRLLKDSYTLNNQKNLFLLISDQLKQASSQLQEARQQILSQLEPILKKQKKLAKTEVSLQYLPSEFSSSKLDEEKARKITLSGAHRDDWLISFKENPLGNFASRGEKRISLLTLLLAIKSLIHQQTKTPIIILLDDPYSELDQQNYKNIYQSLLNNSQTMVTEIGKASFKT